MGLPVEFEVLAVVVGLAFALPVDNHENDAGEEQDECRQSADDDPDVLLIKGTLRFGLRLCDLLGVCCGSGRP